jgi:hypothetical protein
MAMKPNYFQQRADRNRSKEAKKLEKQQKRDEETARRKAEREAGREGDGTPEQK